MGHVLRKIDSSKFERMVQQVNKHFEQEEKEAQNLAESASFNMVLAAKNYDDFFLDPIIGFILPGIGDVISSLAILPALNVALFKLKSVKLSIAILYIAMLDMLCGIIPIAGDIVDAFYKSNKKACRWIVGYIEEDPDTLSEINKSAFWGSIMLVIFGLLIYAIFSLIMSLFHWFSNVIS